MSQFGATPVGETRRKCQAIEISFRVAPPSRMIPPGFHFPRFVTLRACLQLASLLASLHRAPLDLFPLQLLSSVMNLQPPSSPFTHRRLALRRRLVLTPPLHP